MTPTQLSLRLLRKADCLVGIVEHWNSWAKIRVDLFGFGDLIYVDPSGETGLVQTTTSPNMAARRTKILANPNAAIWLSRGNRIVLHGWKKVKGKYECRVEEISPKGSVEEISTSPGS